MITIIGTTKIDTKERLHHVFYNLWSLAPIHDMFTCRLNVAGQYGQQVTKLLSRVFGDDGITTYDDTLSIYDLLIQQLTGLGENDVVFLWQEDHWFICSHVGLFYAVFDQFLSNDVDVLAATHSIPNWERVLPYMTKLQRNVLYSTCLLDLAGQERVWRDHPGSFVTGIPEFYKVKFVRRLMDHQKDYMRTTPLPQPCELAPYRGCSFLQKHSFVKIVPHFHLFREVWWGKGVPPRRIDIAWEIAIDLIKLRDNHGCGDTPWMLYTKTS